MNYFEEEPITHTEKSDQLNDNKAQYPGQRILAFLLFLGSTIATGLRLNLSIAIVEMTSNKTMTVNNQTIYHSPEFHWDSKTKGLIMSSFFYGLIAAPIGGYISEKWGGVWAYGTGQLMAGILTILTPMNVRLNLYWFLFCRIIEGAAESMCYTSISNIWSKWSATEDRSKFISTTFAGFSVGTLITLPICGYIGHEFGWPFIFYTTGGLSILWFIAWISFTRNHTPSHIHSIRKTDGKKMLYIWKKMITSKPVLTLCVAKFIYGWGFNLILVCLPLYVKDTFNVNTSQTGLLSSIPNILSMIAVPLIGYSIDMIINKKWMTSTLTHKWFNITGFFGAAIASILIVLSGNFVSIMVFLTLVKVFTTFNSIVVQLMPLYIAPKCPSIVAGASAVFYTLGNLIVPLFIGFVVTKNTSAQWRIIFISSGVIMAIGGIIALFFSSSEPQSWGMDHKGTDHKSLRN